MRDDRRKQREGVRERDREGVRERDREGDRDREHEGERDEEREQKHEDMNMQMGTRARMRAESTLHREREQENRPLAHKIVSSRHVGTRTLHPNVGQEGGVEDGEGGNGHQEDVEEGSETARISLHQLFPIIADNLYDQIEKVSVICLLDGRILLERDQDGNRAKDVFFGLIRGRCKITFRQPQDKKKVASATLSNTNIGIQLYEGSRRILDLLTMPALKEKYDWYARQTMYRGVTGRDPRRITWGKYKGDKELSGIRRAFLKDILFYQVRDLHPLLDVYCEDDQYELTKINDKGHAALQAMETSRIPKELWVRYDRESPDKYKFPYGEDLDDESSDDEDSDYEDPEFGNPDVGNPWW